MKIALINVVMDDDFQYEQEIPLGLASLGAFLRQQGCQVVFHQCFASRGQEAIEGAAGVAADIFGFQLNLVNYQKVRAVVARLKELQPAAPTVFGGPFLVSLSEKIMREEPLFDFMVVGEGEHTLLELINALQDGSGRDFSSIRGLLWRDGDGNVVKNEIRPAIEELDELPFPARDFLETAKRDPVDGKLVDSIRVITSRGCIGKCSFCCVNLHNKILKAKRWRGRSPKNVVDELAMLVHDYGAKIFNFSDSSFEDPGEKGKRRAREICEEIISRRLSLSAKVYMRCETMKSHEDIALLNLYKQAGIDVIIVGAESGSDYELRFYEKRATVADNLRTVQILRDLDLFYVLVGIIMFGPNSTKQTMLSNLQFVREHDLADNLMQLANVLMLVRGSKLYARLKEEGRVIEGNYWELPKYTFLDPVGERMARHWANLYARYPATKAINTLQVNLGNLVYRMTNPMNLHLLAELGDDYQELKTDWTMLSREFSRLNADYFEESLRQIEHDCPDEKLKAMADEFFGETYQKYIPVYAAPYQNFLDKIAARGVSLSGIVFNHFYSALTVDNTERI